METTNGWDKFAVQIDNAFFFVLDKIIALMDFFSAQARNIGSVVLLIAILTAALNYALTGQGLKENAIKIMKATLFFLVTIAFYPSIIGWITSYTFSLADRSMGGAVRTYFNSSVTENIVVNSGAGGSSFQALSRQMPDRNALALFAKISTTRSARTGQTNNSGRLTYTAFAPAAVVQVMFLISNECLRYADKKVPGQIFPDFGQVLRGLVCGFFIIFTGVFALLEYLVCFLEFMLVACVGIILFPLSIWEGSKFLSEKFIGAVVGFFMKLLFCNLAVLLLLYGFISMLSIFNANGFQATADQIIFIIFTSLLFLFICKSAPGIAQSLLTGTPSLSATGAISAAAGAVAAVSAVAGFAGGAAKTVAGGAKTIVGGGTKAVVGAHGSVTEANAAKTAAMQEIADAGGSKQQIRQAGNRAFLGSLAGDAGDAFKTAGHGLVRNLLGSGGSGSGQGGGGTNPHSWRQDHLNARGKDGGNETLGEHFDKRRQEGAERGQKSAAKYKKNHTPG